MKAEVVQGRGTRKVLATFSTIYDYRELLGIEMRQEKYGKPWKTGNVLQE